MNYLRNALRMCESKSDAVKLAAATSDVDAERGMMSRRNLSAAGVRASAGCSRARSRFVIEWKTEMRRHGRRRDDRPGDMDVVGGRLPWKRAASVRVESQSSLFVSKNARRNKGVRTIYFRRPVSSAGLSAEWSSRAATSWPVYRSTADFPTVVRSQCFSEWP